MRIGKQVCSSPPTIQDVPFCVLTTHVCELVSLVTRAMQSLDMQVREWAADVIPEIASIDIDRVSLTRYPYPNDGHPIVGFTEEVPNLFIAVMHSGATLGPLVGQLAAAEITGTASEQELALLKPYRLERDFSTSQQAYTVGAAQKK